MIFALSGRIGQIPEDQCAVVSLVLLNSMLAFPMKEGSVVGFLASGLSHEVTSQAAVGECPDETETSLRPADA
jgi:hypothetical protein